MKGKSSRVPRFWFSGSELEKDPVKKDLAEAAAEDGASLMEYARRHSIDPAEAQNLVEDLVEDLASKQQGVPESKRIKKPRPYLFTAFVRAVNKLCDKEARVKRLAVAELERLGAIDDWSRQQDQRILIGEIISMMDPATRRTYWRRSEGYAWKEIAQRQGVSVNAAMAAYERGLHAVREKIEGRRQKGQR